MIKKDISNFSINELFNDVRGLHDESLLEYWKHQTDDWPLENKIKYAVKFTYSKNIWFWTPILDYIICTTHPKNGFTLLEKLVEEKGTYLILKNFNEKCKTDTTYVKKYISLLERKRTTNTAIFSGFLRALSFQQTANEWRLLEVMLNSEDSLNQLSSSYTIRVLSNNNWINHESENITNSIFKYLNGENSLEVQKNLIYYFISSYDASDSRYPKYLNKILEEKNELIGITLDALTLDNSVSLELRFQVLNRACDIYDSSLTEKIVSNIWKWGKRSVSDSLELIRKIVLKDTHYVPGGVSWVIDTLCGDNVNECLEVVEGWLHEDISESEKYLRERFTYPSLLLEITNKDRDVLVEKIKIFSDNARFDNLVIYIIKEYLEKIPRKKDWALVYPEDESRLESCIDSLKHIAIKKGKNPLKFPSHKIPKIFQCGQIIELIQKEEIELNTEIIKNNFDKFPEIKRFLSISLDIEQLASPLPLPIFREFSRESYNFQEYQRRIQQYETELKNGKLDVAKWKAYDALRTFSFLSHIDDCLVDINEIESGTSEIRKKLLHENQTEFYSGISEIEVIGRLRRHYNVQISGEVDVLTETGNHFVKKPDLIVHFDDESILIEVISPEMAPIIRYLGGGIIPNRLTGKIISEYKKHFKGQTDDKDVIIIVDTRHSEINSYSAISSTHGSPSIQTLFDHKLKKVIAERLVPANDSITDFEPDTSSILGIILYKEMITQNGVLLLKGKYYLNPKTRSPEKNKFGRMIECAFLDIILEDESVYR